MKICRTIVEIIGWITIAFAIVGSTIDSYDFRFCLAPTGTCFKPN
jgi:hypothetical protein